MSAPSPAATFWGVWEKPLSGTGRSTAVPGRDTAPACTDFYQALHLEEPSSPQGQEYALYKVFIHFNREGTFPHPQESLLICLCHLSPCLTPLCELDRQTCTQQLPGQWHSVGHPNPSSGS